MSILDAHCMQKMTLIIIGFYNIGKYHCPKKLSLNCLLTYLTSI